MYTFFKIFNLALIFPLIFLSTFAIDVNSTNYKINDLSFSNGSEIQQSTNYKNFYSFDEFVSPHQINSSLYTLKAGSINNWIANVPLVQCFETTTDDTTNCEDTDVEKGMVTQCGYTGCYNKARFEIDSQDNPSDTLYSVHISTDSNFTTFDFIDSTTFLIEDYTTHDINDFITESEWENTASNINIYGLENNTTYYLRIIALNGNLTESTPSPTKSSTTSVPSVFFDIDIADITGSLTESSTPYSISLGTLNVNEIKSSTDQIWIDIGTNLNEGAKVFIRDKYEGLYSANTGITIPSVDNDLDSTDGYGAQVNYTSQDTLGPLTAESAYNNGGNIVGKIINLIYSKAIFNTSNNPILNGRGAIQLKVKVDEQTTSSDDYTDTIIISVSADI